MATIMPSQSQVDIEQGNPPRSSGEESCSNESCLTHVVVNDKVTRSLSSSSSSSSSSTSCESVCSVEDVLVEDLESGGGGGGGGVVVTEAKLSVHSAKVERDCRICHLSLDGSNSESGFPIELGCSCKDDLAAAHKHCAEAWFKIRGNKTCEICGSTARNVVGVNEVELVEQWNEGSETALPAAPSHSSEARHFWQGHRFLNFLLACMVFAFVISWLFHFNVPS